LSASCFSQLSHRIPAEDARLDIIISISSEISSPFSTLVSNNSTAEKAVFTILVSVHLSQLQLHMVALLQSNLYILSRVCPSFYYLFQTDSEV
jgi:hypothetical protein